MKYFSVANIGKDTYQTTIGIGALNYIKNNVWRPIDTTIKTKVPHSDYSNGCDEVDFHSGHNHKTNGVALHVEHNGIWVYLRPATKVGGPATPITNKISHDLTGWIASAIWEQYVTPEGVISLFRLPAGFSSPISFKVKTNTTPQLIGNDIYFGQLRIPQPFTYDDAASIKIYRPASHSILSIGGGNYTYTVSGIDTTGMTSPVLDPSITFQPDDTAGIDNNLYYEAGLGQDNFGGQFDGFNVGHTTGLSSTPARGIIKFVFSGIPTDHIINDVTLSLYDYDNAFRTVDGFPVDVYFIHNTNGDWVEGTASGTPQVGSSCYLYKAYNTVVWKDSAGAGDYPGLGAPGDGYETTPIATTSIPDGSTGFRDFVFTAAGRTKVSNIIKQTQQNNGFLFRTTDEATSGKYVGFRPSEWTTAGERPKITVNWTTITPTSSYLLLANL